MWTFRLAVAFEGISIEPTALPRRPVGSLFAMPLADIHQLGRLFLQVLYAADAAVWLAEFDAC
jgi:hypothetical protein